MRIITASALLTHFAVVTGQAVDATNTQNLTEVVIRVKPDLMLRRVAQAGGVAMGLMGLEVLANAARNAYALSHPSVELTEEGGAIVKFSLPTDYVWERSEEGFLYAISENREQLKSYTHRISAELSKGKSFHEAVSSAFELPPAVSD